MFDNSLMVIATAITLRTRLIQQNHGRWLNFVSGLAVLGLGLVMLFRPNWLFGPEEGPRLHRAPWGIRDRRLPRNFTKLTKFAVESQ